MEYLTHAVAFWLGGAFAVSEAVRIGKSANSPLVNFLVAVLAWPLVLYGVEKRKREKENRH